jgi:hypothetical protein
MIRVKPDEQALFIGMLEKYLNSALNSKFSNECLNRDTLHAIKHEIHDRFVKVFNDCDFHVSEQSISFIVDEYFMGVKINGTPLIDMLIMSTTKPEDVPDQDLDTLIDLFRDTNIGDKLEESRRKR